MAASEEPHRTARFTVALTHKGTWYVARCLEVEVTSQGETVENALTNLREALELYFEDVPLGSPPETPMIAWVDVQVRGT